MKESVMGACGPDDAIQIPQVNVPKFVPCRGLKGENPCLKTAQQLSLPRLEPDENVPGVVRIIFSCEREIGGEQWIDILTESRISVTESAKKIMSSGSFKPLPVGTHEVYILKGIYLHRNGRFHEKMISEGMKRHSLRYSPESLACYIRMGLPNGAFERSGFTNGVVVMKPGRARSDAMISISSIGSGMCLGGLSPTVLYGPTQSKRIGLVFVRKKKLSFAHALFESF